MDNQENRIKKGYELTKSLEYPANSVFVISDLHLDHENIISYCNRPFDSVREMNQVLIKNWNYVVKPDDIVYFIGDMTLGNSNKFIEELNGNIYFIWGNHDETDDVDSMHESIRHTYKGIEFLFIHDPATAPKDYQGWIIHGHHHNKLPRLFPFFDPEEKRVNVSVEMVKYQPVLLDYIHSLIIEGHEKITKLENKMIRTATSNEKKYIQIGKEKILREKGYLYIINKDGSVWAVPMKHNKTGKKHMVGTERPPKEKGFKPLIDTNDRFVAKAKMKNA